MQSNQKRNAARPRAKTIAQSRWHDTPSGLPGITPSHARRWLTTAGSLTAAVRRVSIRGGFSVRRQFEGWRRMLYDEAAALHASPRQKMWTREVLLCDGERALVFAHTVATRTALAAWPWLRGLGDKPLGEVLFQHHGVSRNPFEFCRLDVRHRLYRAAVLRIAAYGQFPPYLYARRSVFVLHGQPILVTEVFLPEILQRD